MRDSAYTTCAPAMTPMAVRLPANRPTRRSVALTIGMFLGLGISSAMSAERMVEDWRGQSVGARGIPSGWEAYRSPGGRPKYDFTVVDVDGRRALHLKSHGDRSTIARAVDVDLRATPILEWSWKALRLPAGADVRQSATSDSAAQILVVWPRSPEAIRSRVIAYAWDTSAPANSIERSRKSGMVTFVIVRSGPAGLAQWLGERRNVYIDYRRIYGEEPDPVRALALSIDTNDTRAPAEAFVGPIAFSRA